MEQKSHGEIGRSKGAVIVENIRKWTRDNLTLKGRENAIYQKKYDEALKNLPKDMNESQMARIELRLRQQAHSRAIGSIVTDVLFAGTAVVGTGMLLGRLGDNRPFLSPVQRRAVQRMEERGAKAMDGVANFAKSGARFGKDLVRGSFLMVTFPLRMMGRAGSYVWGLFGGPEMAQLAGYTVKNTLRAVPETVKAVKKAATA